MLPFALTIFTGAFLLFQVQPLIGKFILPWFGGGPGVWTTCLLFFQVVLLGGYAYAHFSTSRLSPRRQVMLHAVLLAVSLALLPITPGDGWKSDLGGDPNLRILLLLAATIGLPYFVLSSTGPLMQQWFSQTNPGVSPYRLYALSNVGSLLALLSYPAYFEVKFSRQAQAVMWSAGLAVFAILCGVCAWILWRRSPASAPAGPGTAKADSVPAGTDEAPSATDRFLWVVLPMVASVLLLATTNKLCQEVAVIPFLWVLPLALYLLSFIICFDHARWYHRGTFISLLVIGMAVAAQILPAGTDVPMRLQIAAYNVVLFLACMVCHGELYRLKPAPARLTSYFLLISLGGALGGFLVAIVAPAFLSDYRELQLGLWLLSYLLGVLCFRHASREIGYAAAIGAVGVLAALPGLNTLFDGGRPIGEEYLTFFKDRWPYIAAGVVAFILGAIDFRRFRLSAEWQPRLAGFVMALSVGLGAVFVMTWEDRRRDDILSATRNFYGTLKVINYNAGDEEENYHLLLHGATTHGIQFTRPDKAVMPTTYYADASGVGLAINNLPQTPRRLGLVGLGTGTLAAYARGGDYLRIYEINPDVEQLARKHFKYLDYCQGKVDIVMGDARLMMDREVAAGNTQKFDLLALDAFSSDAIPVHLLTREAFQTYLRQIRDDGVIAVHISNRYLDLRPVVERLAAEFGLSTVCISEDSEANWWVYATTWVLVSRDKNFLAAKDIAAAADTAAGAKAGPLWTDDFASLYAILK
jgi:spermidine synthase